MQLFYAKNIGKMRAFWKLEKTATKQRLYPVQNRHFRWKIKNAKQHAKNVSRWHSSWYVRKRLEKQLIFEKWDHSKHWLKRPPSKGDIAFAKWSLCQNLKKKKQAKNVSTRHCTTSFPGSLFSASIVVENGGRDERPWERGWTLQLFCAKNGSKKTGNGRKMRPFWKLAKMSNKQRL